MREKFDVRRCVVQPMDPAYKEKFEQLTGPLSIGSGDLMQLGPQVSSTQGVLEKFVHSPQSAIMLLHDDPNADVIKVTITDAQAGVRIRDMKLPDDIQARSPHPFPPSRPVRTCVAPHVRPPPAGAHCSARCDDNHAPRLHQAAQNRRDDDLRPTQLARVRHGDEEREGHLGVLKTKGGVESTRSSYPVDSYKDRIPWLLTVFSCESALLLSEKKFMLLWKIESPE